MLTFVFGFCIGFRLPLHVAWCVGTTAREWNDVIDDVVGAAVRISRHVLKLALCALGAMNAAVVDVVVVRMMAKTDNLTEVIV